MAASDPTAPVDPAPADDVTAAPSPAPETFDPSAHSVDDVLEHLLTLDDDDAVLAVLHAEQAGKNRRGILTPYAETLAAADADEAPAGDADDAPAADGDDDAPDAPADAFPAPQGAHTREGIVERRDATDDDGAAAGSGRPVWNVRTHGLPSPAQRERYDVVGE